MARTTHSNSTVRKNLRAAVGIGFILASGFRAAPQSGDGPPADLPRKVAARESENRAARDNYTYRQSVVVEEMDARGGRAGEFRELREVIFNPKGERSERVVGKTSSTLKRLKLTEEDFRDVREVQPFLFTTDQVWMYGTRFRGEETIDGVDCWVLEVKPRQTLEGQRLFEGMLWIEKSGLSVVRSEGRAVPEIRTHREENLFPRFTTVRLPVDGKYWFPAVTHADDTLGFRSGPLRLRLTIRYSDYRRFGAESTIRYEK